MSCCVLRACFFNLIVIANANAPSFPALPPPPASVRRYRSLPSPSYSSVGDEVRMGIGLICNRGILVTSC